MKSAAKQRVNSTAYKATQARKDKAMYDLYTKLCNVKGNGVQKLTHEYIMGELVKHYFLDEVTIMRRIKAYARDKDRDPAQLSINLPS